MHYDARYARYASKHGSANAKLRLQMLARHNYVHFAMSWILQCLECPWHCISPGETHKGVWSCTERLGLVPSRANFIPKQFEFDGIFQPCVGTNCFYNEKFTPNAHACVICIHSGIVDMFQWHSARWFQRRARIAKSLCLAFQWACRKCSEILPEGVDVLQNSESILFNIVSFRFWGIKQSH